MKVTVSLQRNAPDFLLVPGHQDFRFAIHTELPSRIWRRISRAVRRYDRWKDYLRKIEEEEWARQRR